MNDNGPSFIAILFSSLLTMAQTNEVFQIISLILTIAATLVTLGFNIYKWYKAAKKDGKIDENEIKELVDIINDAKDDLDDK